MFTDRLFIEGRVKARPAGSGLELCIGFEKRLAAAHAIKQPRAFLILMGAGESAFRAVLAGDVILLGRQLLAPLRVGFFDLGHLRFRVMAEENRC